MISRRTGVVPGPKDSKDVRLRTSILRTVLHGIVVDVDAEAGEIILTLHWKGGVDTELRLPQRRRGQNSSQTIAGVRNRNGLQTGRGNRWTRERTRARREHPVLRQQASIGSSNNLTQSRPSYGRPAIVVASFFRFPIYVKSALMSWFPLELFKFFGPVGLLRYSKLS